LEDVSRSVNKQRFNFSEKGQLAAKKSGKRKCKMIWQVDKKTKIRIRSFNNSYEAAEVTKIDQSDISKADKNILKHAGGFYWEFDASVLEPSRKDPIDGIQLMELSSL
jgi:hypothetical protein